MRFIYLIIGGLIFSFSVNAAPKSIVQCSASSARFPDAYIELFEDENGKLSSGYTLGVSPIYYPTWTTAGSVTSPPARFIELMNGVNKYRETGIDPNKVKLFQNIFIDGSNKWAVELWKLMDEDGKVLGWMVSAYRDAMGCY